MNRGRGIAGAVLLAAVAGVVLTSTTASVGGPPAAPGRLAAHTAPWVWPSPDSRGRMSLGPLVTYEAPRGLVARVGSPRAMGAAIAAGLGPRPGATVDDIRLGFRLLDSPTGPPVWVVEYAHDPMLLGGPPGLGDEARRQILASGVCELVVVVSADTGQVLTSVQACWPRGADLVGGYAG